MYEKFKQEFSLVVQNYFHKINKNGLDLKENADDGEAATAAAAPRPETVAGEKEPHQRGPVDQL
jgi:hypothetical protein